MFPEEVKIPKEIFHVIVEYSNGEDWHFLPCRVEGERGYYYYTHYASNRMLMIREDGTVPPFAEVKSAMALASFFLGHCQQLVDMKESYTIFNVFFTIRDLLRKIDHRLRPTLPEEMGKALDRFIETVEQVLKYKKMGEEALSQAEAFAKQFMNEKAILIPKHLDELDRFRKPIGGNLHRITQVQVESFEEREKLVCYLMSHVSIFQFRLWRLCRQLKFHHERMPDRVSPGEEAIVKDIERMLADEEWKATADEEQIKEIEKLAINPK